MVITRIVALKKIAAQGGLYQRQILPQNAILAKIFYRIQSIDDALCDLALAA